MKKGYLLLIFLWMISAISYFFLPEILAMHWGFSGQYGYWSKQYGVFFLPVLTLILDIFILCLPRLEPTKQKKVPYKEIVLVFNMFMIFLQCGIIMFNLGIEFDFTKFTFVLIGVLIIGLGYLMPKTKRNYFVGIRTPWTLSNDRIWEETHRFAKKTMIVGGILMIFVSLFDPIIGFIPLIFGVLAPVFYSLYLFKH